MPQPLVPVIREVLLKIIHEQQPQSNSGPTLQQTSVLNAAAKELGIRFGDPTLEEAVLTEWGELFRTGILAWGLNLNNPNPPFFHLTTRGRQALASVTRDPSNPAGYMRHLASVATLTPVTMSYLREGLECYVAGLHKAAAVMVGAAAESVVFALRDEVVQKLKTVGKPVPSALKDWRAKTVTDALTKVFDNIDRKNQRELRERFDANWAVFSHQIRTVRNDAGHPTSIDPVSADAVHASLLAFPELAKLAADLEQWVSVHLV